MSPSDDETEARLVTLSIYHFVDDEEEPICFMSCQFNGVMVRDRVAIKSRILLQFWVRQSDHGREWVFIIDIRKHEKL